MKRDDSVYLRHVLDAIARIETYLRDVDEQTFLNQSLLQDGAIRQIEIIGEAVKDLSLCEHKLKIFGKYRYEHGFGP